MILVSSSKYQVSRFFAFGTKDLWPKREINAVLLPDTKLIVAVLILTT
jgi:hypothetical protein